MQHSFTFSDYTGISETIFRNNFGIIPAALFKSKYEWLKVGEIYSDPKIYLNDLGEQNKVYSTRSNCTSACQIGYQLFYLFMVSDSIIALNANKEIRLSTTRIRVTVFRVWGEPNVWNFESGSISFLFQKSKMSATFRACYNHGVWIYLTCVFKQSLFYFSKRIE